MDQTSANLPGALDAGITNPLLTLQTHFSAKLAQWKSVVEESPQRAFRKIGKGYTGVVFNLPGETKVLKKAVSKDLAPKLFNDLVIGTEVKEKFLLAAFFFGDSDRLPLTPRYHAYFAREDGIHRLWWSENVHNLPDDESDPQDFIIEERVLPLAKPIRDALIDLYCNAAARDAAKMSPGNEDCIARLLLGRCRSSDAPHKYFSLRNFQIHLDQAEQICHSEILRYTKQMATAMAVMHFFCENDANDVEFVLGSAPPYLSYADDLSSRLISSIGGRGSIRGSESFYHDIEANNFTPRQVHLWIIDFDKVNRITLDEAGIDRAILAADTNDPYLPRQVRPGRPSHELWTTFAKEYMHTAMEIFEMRGLEHCNYLPTRFLAGWYKARIEKEEKRPS